MARNQFKDQEALRSTSKILLPAFPSLKEEYSLPSQQVCLAELKSTKENRHMKIIMVGFQFADNGSLEVIYFPS